MSPTERSSPSPYESRFPRKPTSAPTGGTDRLADWFLPTVPEPHAVNEGEDGPGGWDEMASVPRLLTGR